MPVGGDMCTPCKAAPAIVKQMNKRGELPKMKFSSFEEAFKDIDFSEKTKKLPLVFGDPTRLRQALNIICKEFSVIIL